MIDDSVRLMTYNVHGCVGTDGRLSPERVAQVIREADPDVVALQELDVGRPRSGAVNQPALLASLLGYDLHFTSARGCDPGEYGNAILTRLPFEVRSEGILPCAAGERRAVQWVRVRLGSEEIDVLNTHLSLNAKERWLQVAALLSAEWLSHVERADATVICGDFNAMPFSRVYRKLASHMNDAQKLCRTRKNTWPSAYPLCRIDHVFVSRGTTPVSVEVPRHSTARVASDHLPLVVELRLSGANASSLRRAG